MATKNKKQIRILDKDEKFNDYFFRQFYKYLREPGTYIYGTICMIGPALYWYQEDLLTMLRVFFLLSTAFSITFFLSEIFSIWTLKEIRKNKLITVTIATSVFLIITNIYFDNRVRYWSMALGLILFIAVPISWAVTKIRLRM